MLPPPFNLITLPMVPLLWGLSKESAIKLNKVVMYILWTPLGFSISLIYFTVNAVIMPFAYLVALWDKLKAPFAACCCKRENEDAPKPFSIALCDLIVWILLGKIFLCISLIKDTGLHFYEMYIWEVARTIPEKLLRVDLHSFVRIENRMIHEAKLLNK
jgi:hypothetical protein